jgi:hypothetical protein
MKRINGVELWRGASRLDGSPIVAILTGLGAKSQNAKTGGMAQSYILPAEVSPLDLYREGGDAAICGDCPHRGKPAGGTGGCYVNLGHGPRSVWNCWRNGSGYKIAGTVEARYLLNRADRPLRIGTYGDPAAVPAYVWKETLGYAGLPVESHTGYTHQWRGAGASLRGLVMASCDSLADLVDAWRLGWATFRVAKAGDPLRLKGEARCPASSEAGKRVTCATCPIPCDGTTRPGIRGRVIQAHGTTAAAVTGG